MAHANAAVGQAKKNGELIPQPCSICGTTENIHAHHEDYEKPLDVIWYCAKHHKQRHAEIGDALVDVKSGNCPISLRIDEEILNFVDAEAARRKWSRNTVIQTCVEQALPELEREQVGTPSKKIADVLVGAGAQGDPGLRPMGKVEPLGDRGALLAKLRGVVKEIEAKPVEGFVDEPREIDLCGEKFYNDVDGENYVCGKEKHGPKVKHGEWIKV